MRLLSGDRMDQKQNLMLRRLNIVLTGLLFAAYAVYNIFIIIRDGRGLPAQGIFISALVALGFALFSAFVLTAGVRSKNPRFLMIRRITFILALLLIFLLKLRMVGQVVEYIDFSQLNTVIYGAAYFMTLAALLLLFIYYVFLRRIRIIFPRAAVFLIVAALILFLLSFIMEIILFFGYGIGIEANTLRTVVIRPIFYLGFIGLSLYFLFPPQSIILPKKKKQAE